jgi:hypothetical protein
VQGSQLDYRRRRCGKELAHIVCGQLDTGGYTATDWNGFPTPGAAAAG